MKIIKKGKFEKTWTKRYKCTGKGHGGGGCRAVLELTSDDLFLDYEYADSITIHFECPQCTSVTKIPTNDVPDKFREMIPRDYKDWKHNQERGAKK